MVRTVATDFLHSMRFHVTFSDNSGNPAGYLLGGARDVGTSQAGFSACSTPSLSSEVVEYKEGSFIYPRKYPGNPSVEDISLSRGVARQDSSFWNWIQAAVEGGPITGSGSYRGDLKIDHYHRDKTFAAPIDPKIGKQQLNLEAEPGRSYLCMEAFPTTHKVASDLDATASEISVMELTVAMEYFLVIEGAP